jgi:hypothetical protein
MPLISTNFPYFPQKAFLKLELFYSLRNKTITQKKVLSKKSENYLSFNFHLRKWRTNG